jgi:hypothetical protein
MTPVLEAHFARLKARYPGATLRDLPSGAALVTVPGFAVSSGWLATQIVLRFIAPNGYSVAAPDCFWAEPNLTLSGGRQPKNSQINNAIPEADMSGHWFSWHVEGGRWSANCHDLLTWVSLCLDRLQKLE